MAFNWLRELLEIRQESKVCKSCEILKHELEVTRLEKRELLNTIIHPTIREEPRIDTSELKPVLPTHVPWSTRRHMLEANDRKTAQLRKRNEDDAASITTKDLEVELGIVAAEREAKTGA